MDNTDVLLFQNGPQHRARTDHLQDCPSCVEFKKKIDNLNTILTKKDANIKSLLATVQSLQQELAI